ncbi:MAG: Uma2 family endonuclease [Labilithrix sp.]|nr:Uma2 family endonuclease [Labilithrix sp.]MCW5815603.1 Uma2 family endonuclease [Labilithrix sp.]
MRRAEPARDQRMLLTGVSWDQYIALSELFNGRPSVRLTYIDGVLEIMTTGPLHERLKTLLARLLEVYALARGVRLHGYGSTTYRRKAKKRGLEPDECYFVGEVDGPFPHLAIEVAISSGGLDKLPVYAGLGVREVWIWKKGRLTVHRFQSGTYVPAVRSALLPALDLEELARFATIEDQPEAVAAYFTHLTRRTTPRRAKKARSRR